MHASGVILPITTVCSLSLVRYKLSLGIMTLGSELLNARIPPSPPPPLLCVLFLSLSLSLSLSRARARTSVSVSLCLCVSHVSLLVSGGSSLEKVTTITPRISHQATPPRNPKDLQPRRRAAKGLSLSVCLSSANSMQTVCMRCNTDSRECCPRAVLGHVRRPSVRTHATCVHAWTE